MQNIVKIFNDFKETDSVTKDLILNVLQLKNNYCMIDEIDKFVPMTSHKSHKVIIVNSLQYLYRN